ncbi:hypothetical protein [Anaerovibrio sp. JC8]|uniref:hypothetical protein n=1 Tax=Anaerovibrio sp. JC8 TaxID=1240085 RepID=UPI001178A9AF|nr:hypothetical protein [Anaerovibrio sp. JC8]
MLKQDKNGLYQRSENGGKKCRVYMDDIYLGVITKDEMYRLADSSGKKIVYLDGDEKTGINGCYCIVSEDVYRAIKQDDWREAKRKERNKKAIEESFDKSTSHKEFRRIAVMPVGDYHDSMQYEYGQAEDPENIICNKELLAELRVALDSLLARDKKIMKLFSNEFKDAVIGELVGMSQRGVNKRKPVLLAKLRKILEKMI